MKRFYKPLGCMLFLIVQTGVFRFLFLYEDYYLYGGIALIVLSDIGLFALLPKRQTKSLIITLTASSVLLTASSLAMGVFLESILLKNILVGSHAFLQSMYLLNMYYYFYRRESYQERSLWHTTSTMNTVTFFFVSSTVFALAYFLGVPVLYSLVPYFFFVFGLSVQMMYIHELSFKEYIRFPVTISATVCSVILSLAWLPSTYYINAVLATVYFYSVSNIGISALRKELTTRDIRNYFIVSLIVVVLVIGTAQWR